MNEFYLWDRGWPNERSTLEPFEIQPRGSPEGSKGSPERVCMGVNGKKSKGSVGATGRLIPCSWERTSVCSSWEISEDGKISLKSEEINFKHLPGSENANLA